MADFFVRVEMHGATGPEYDALHSAMYAGGFFRSIMASDGRKFSLPTAEYHIILNDNTTAEQVRAKAFAIANSVKAAPWVLAMKVTDWSITSKIVT